MKKLIHWDMETGDPDDAMTLCLLATHPRADLRSVTVHPGGRDQVGLVQTILTQLGREDVRVGADPPDDEKRRVSGFHHRWLGSKKGTLPFGEPDGSVTEVIQETLTLDRPVTLITGAALRNPARALKYLTGDVSFFTWVCQGGFAGDNIVPPEHRLEKFEGMLTCPTYNLNGDPTAAWEMLRNKTILHKWMVSKNVCHGVFHGPEEQAALPRGAHQGLDMVLDAMALYLERKPAGKALHDILAAVAALDPFIADWREVQPYREGGGWGSKEVEEGEPVAQIAISIDKARFLRSMVE